MTIFEQQNTTVSHRGTNKRIFMKFSRQLQIITVMIFIYSPPYKFASTLSVCKKMAHGSSAMAFRKGIRFLLWDILKYPIL